jgi:hypothetical protein
MDRPTAEDYRLDTRIDWVSLGLPEQAPDVILQEEIDDAWAYVKVKTCLDLDSLDPLSNEGRLALRAIKLRTIQQAYHRTPGYMSGSFNNLIKSFAVPGYSETKFDPLNPDQAFKLNLINENPQIAELLWSIMTEECKNNILAQMTGVDTPFSTIDERDWFYPHSYRNPGSGY